MKKLISIGTDRKIFEEGSAVRQRQVEYGKFFDESHIIVFSKRKFKILNSKFETNLKSKIQISEKVWAYPTNSRNKLFYIIDAFLIIRKLFKNSKLKIENSRNNVIISCQDPFETGLVGAAIKVFFDLPLHVQIHTDMASKYFIRASHLNKVRSMVSEFVLKYSDRVRVVSERIKKSIEKFSENIDVLPIKAEVPQGDPLGNFPKGSPWGIKKPFPFTLIMVCRLEKEKNIETVLKAIKKLDKPDLGLCIVGDGGERGSLELKARSLEIEDKVVFVGWQDNLAPYYKMADAFVSSSLYEGYGVSTVEAASFGKPLLISDTGLAGEMFSDQDRSTSGGEDNISALICDAKDVNCFAQNILKIYEDKDLREGMGQSAKMIADNYLNSQDNYFKTYADSIINTAKNFKKSGLWAREWRFKTTVWHSFVFLRYFVCGVTAAAINIGSLYVFTDVVGIWYLYSSVFAFLLSLIVSFVLQKFFVFKDMKTEKLHYQFSKFSVVAILGVITNTTLVYVFTDVIGFWYILSQLIAGFFVMIQNFLLYKFFIFNKGY